MIVHHARGLHKGVANGGTDKGESTLLQIFAHGVGNGSARRYVSMLPPRILNWLAAYELPKIFVERAKLFRHGQTRPRILHRAVNLQPVAHDARIGQQLFQPRFAIAGDFSGIEIVKRQAVARALFEDGRPAQPRLRALQNQKLEQRAIIEERNAPLCVVIYRREGIGG